VRSAGNETSRAGAKKSGEKKFPTPIPPIIAEYKKKFGNLMRNFKRKSGKVVDQFEKISWTVYQKLKKVRQRFRHFFKRLSKEPGIFFKL